MKRFTSTLLLLSLLGACNQAPSPNVSTPSPPQVKGAQAVPADWLARNATHTSKVYRPALQTEPLTKATLSSATQMISIRATKPLFELAMQRVGITTANKPGGCV